MAQSRQTDFAFEFLEIQMSVEERASLDERYLFRGRPYFLNGTQSLVRLIMLEQRRRAAQGKHTAVYVTGYRGSPLGSFDLELARARAFLNENVVINPAVNEDLAATAVWGTQQLGTFGKGRHEGVSALWYGKGPGVDRSGDALKHGNLAGSAHEGGVLVVAGDDHTCKSSTTAHQSEYALMDAMIPILAPASLAEQMEYGLIGWELSRYSGLWAGLKVVTEIMDSSASLQHDPIINLSVPADFEMPAAGLSLRWPDTPLQQEERLHRQKLPAAIAFCRANGLDRLVFGEARARIGIVCVGKAYADTRQALIELGIDEVRAKALGLKLYKVGMPWPLEPEGVRRFGEGLEQIIVVEEKRGLVEDQLRQHLYLSPDRPVIVGKKTETGEWLFPSNGELGADVIAIALGERILKATGDDTLSQVLSSLREKADRGGAIAVQTARTPYFCPGCPHNTSTVVPEGSKAFAGIGCHYLVQPMERQTEGFTQMGGEGGNWVGLAPFSSTEHMFQNIGDGTYFHSGSLAIRAAIAAKINVTYKILFNHAVAMTGGQAVDGGLTLQMVAAQVAAEGAQRVVIVSDDPSRYGSHAFPANIGLYHRDDLDKVQRELRQVKGVSVLIYDQTCATELRRMRKRGKIADPDVSVVINDLVCEGCGDCSRVSNCLAVAPVETEFGRKREIDLSACNKDQSCLKGFCPSFVTVEGGARRKPVPVAHGQDVLPEPVMAANDGVSSIIVTGIGGSGVVTIGALIGMAAHLDGKAVRIMDMTGLAQKGGAVVSHIQVAPAGHTLESAKISAGAADLLLGCDLVVAAAPVNLSRISHASGRIIASDHETATGAFIRDPSFAVPVAALRQTLIDSVQPEHAEFCDASKLATNLVGDAVGANLFLVGFAWQRGLIPVSHEALYAAIKLNGVAVELNTSAFDWGRRAALDLHTVEQAAKGRIPDHQRKSISISELISRRMEFLTDYQDASYAARFTHLVNEVRDREARITPGRSDLTASVAQSFFQLMAYKDEYEVARLYTQTGFINHLHEQFEGPIKLRFHLAPPILNRRDPVNGELRKSQFGSWMLTVFKMLSKVRRLRGTRFDLFGYSQERRMERQLIHDYEALLRDEILPALNARNYDAACELARVHQTIKGYGHIKLRNVKSAHSRLSVMRQRFLETANVEGSASEVVQLQTAAP